MRVLIELPVGPSKADGTLKADVLKQIAQREAASNRTASEVQEVRLLPDGREVWILDVLHGCVAYVVQFTPSAGGGTDFVLEGPTAFRRNG